MNKNMRILLSFFIITTFAVYNLRASVELGPYFFIHGSRSLLAVYQRPGYKLYCNIEKRYVSESIYEDIYGYYAYSGHDNMVVVVFNEDKFGLIDAENGKEVLSPSDSPITVFKDSTYVREPLVWNIDGKIEMLISKPVYIQGLGYHQDLNPKIYYYSWSSRTFELGNPLYGFSDREGKEVIPPLYDRADPFIDDVAVIVVGVKYGVINSERKQIVPFDYDMIEYLPKVGLFKVFKVEDFEREQRRGRIFTADNMRSVSSLKGLIDRDGKSLYCYVH